MGDDDADTCPSDGASDDVGWKVFAGAHALGRNERGKAGRALLRDGHQVTGVGSVAAARAELTTHRFELLLLDLALPDGSGEELCQRLRAAGADLPVLVLTAKSAVASRVEVLDAGADGLLPEHRERVQLEVAGEALVRGDPALLRALLVNAIENGLKFSVPLPVTVKVGDDGALVSVAVIDSGPGVPGNERTRVFEPFYRVAGVVEPGHGLGLALIRHIAAAHAGCVRFLPVSGGAHLRLELPVWQASSSPGKS